MTLDELMALVAAAPAGGKVRALRRALRRYDGDDKALVAPWLMEGAILEDGEAGEAGGAPRDAGG